ncbi:hypothetical protein R3X25_12110 [Lutibacter sp. TH_r2]|uniref:hypothetical protein n=1 Tax=Lutibacter sp. TH_r2 TaxID=3082083 RepID=UPI0029549CC9|nr:hypothetical protein [Lutibacter sp. TH_r2]MDV7188028.1 hypothetical protein [Lutibacter sp. TH_r2]
MKLFYIKRETRTENRFSPKMGRLITRVTYIKRYLLGIPLKTLHKYRETYYGEIKNEDDCHLYI